MGFIEASRKLPEQGLFQTGVRNILEKEEDDYYATFPRICFDIFNVPRF